MQYIFVQYNKHLLKYHVRSVGTQAHRGGQGLHTSSSRARQRRHQGAWSGRYRREPVNCAHARRSIDVKHAIMKHQTQQQAHSQMLYAEQQHTREKERCFEIFERYKCLCARKRYLDTHHAPHNKHMHMCRTLSSNARERKKENEKCPYFERTLNSSQDRLYSVALNFISHLSVHIKK